MTEFVPENAGGDYLHDALVSAFVRLRARSTAMSPPEDLDPTDPHGQHTARLWAV